MSQGLVSLALAAAILGLIIAAGGGRIVTFILLIVAVGLVVGRWDVISRGLTILPKQV